MSKDATRDEFGVIQLFWYVFSSLCMTLYSVHFACSILFENKFELSERVLYHASFEVFILFGRYVNEIVYKRWGFLDLLHHSVFLYGTYLGFTVDSFKPYSWLLCHMQVLHYPMMLWYLGCKRGSFSSEKKIIKYCKSIFPFLWLLSVSYRFSIMLCSSFMGFFAKNYVPSVVMLLFGLIMAYLDVGWTDYFLKTLNIVLSNSTKYFILTLGVVSGLFVSFCL